MSEMRIDKLREQRDRLVAMLAEAAIFTDVASNRLANVHTLLARELAVRSVRYSALLAEIEKEKIS